MGHKGTQRIETERLILRKLEMEDAEIAFNNWCNDDEVVKFLTWATHQNVKETKETFVNWIKSYEEMDFYHWGIVLKEINEMIGTISVVNSDEKAEKMEIGYCIGKDFWHRGIMTEALKGVISFLFKEVGVNRIEAKHSVYNPNSGEVMKKCGLIYEGTQRESIWSNYGITDANLYGILRKDYEREYL